MNRQKIGMDYTGYIMDKRITQLRAKYKPHRRSTLGEPRKRGSEELEIKPGS
jgi:hypothetical protein